MTEYIQSLYPHEHVINHLLRIHQLPQLCYLNMTGYY